ncbi:hypothetical protein ACQY1Q_02835 [Tenacibaculum sp. TC6]|uniref:hypothetical protein n=1 Tax=Tenacibaculum sp. TC6 TaxID=3423223 RepID=UPI003D36968C
MKYIKQHWQLFLIASLTLGLAPFKESHIIGKIKWIIGGNAFTGEHAMNLLDWFDVLLHGTPWVLLITSVILNFYSKISK